MNISRQIIALPIAVSVLACALMAAGLVYLGAVSDRITRGRELEIAETGLRSAIARTEAEALARAELIAGLPAVQEAVARRDDAALEAMMAPGWEVLRDQTGVEQLQFHIPPATSLLRVHALDKRGDDLSAFRKTVVDANASGTSLAALERGRAGLGARGVAVVRHQGAPVGTVEVGLSLGKEFLASLAAATGNDYEYYALPEEGIARFDPAKSADLRVAASFQGAALLGPDEIAALRAGGTYDASVTLEEARHMLRAIAVTDYEGKVAGIFTVAAPTAIYDGLVTEGKLVTALVTLLAVGLALALALRFGRGIVAQIAALSRTTVALATGQTDVEIRGTERGDELGEMARALRVFADNLVETARIEAALRAEEAQLQASEEARRAEEARAEAARQEAARAEEERRARAEAEEMEAARAREEEAQARLAEQSAVVSALARGLEALARGDLSASLTEPLPGDYEKLRLDYNDTLNQLAFALGEIGHGAKRIDGEAALIARSSDDLSRTTETNAATLEETAAALNELTASVQSAADGAREATEIAGAARRNAELGVEGVEQALSAMSEIEASARAISRITSVIEEIAFQTNLLALNAGVEAARAGEAGRGFAVVASEVRALAQRSSEAAKEISTLIAASDEQVHSGVKLVGKTGQALSEIMGSVTEISSRVIQIAASAGEQASGIVEINAAVNQLDRTTQQTSAMFDAIHASGRSLASESTALNDAVNIFVLPSSAPDQTAIAAE